MSIERFSVHQTAYAIGVAIERLTEWRAGAPTARSAQAVVTTGNFGVGFLHDVVS